MHMMPDCKMTLTVYLSEGQKLMLLEWNAVID